MNFKDEKYITNFGINGQHYYIYPDKIDGIAGNGRKERGYPADADIVGQLRIGEDAYVVTRCTKSETGMACKAGAVPPDVLTRRELQIIMLVAEGKPNKQIAQQLHISAWTVSTHLRRIFAKLDVDSRASMIYRCSKLIEMLKP